MIFGINSILTESENSGKSGGKEKNFARYIQMRKKMQDEQLIKEFHRTNVIIWIGIIVTVVVLGIIIFIIDDMNIFQPISNAAQINQIIFFIAVVIAFAILFLKRSFFLPEKIISKIPEKPIPEKINLCLVQIRKNYIIVWGLGEAIVVLGFVNYILTVDFQYFLVFSIVGVYSILINIPRIVLATNCVERIREAN